MKIKRLIAGSLTAVAAGATIMGGALAAATFDQGMGQFVSVSGGVLTSPVIVVGASVDSTDVIGAADIAASLVSNYAVTEKVIPSTSATASVSNGVLVDSSLNKTYMAKNLGLVKSALTETDLPDLLKTQTFTDKNSTTSTYTQKIVLNPAGSAVATFGVPSGETEPVLHLPIATATTPYNLTVAFIGGLDPTAVDTTYKLKLFGKEYTFGNVHTNSSLELYSSVGAQVTDLIGAGDEKSVTVGDKTFTIKLNGWDNGGTTAYLSINGQSYTWTEGSTNTVNEVKFYVQSVDVIYTGAQTASGTVKVFVGTDKLTLTNGNQMSKNDVTKNSYVYFASTAANKINSLTFQVFPDDDVYVKEGVAMTDPVFGSFKTVLSDMKPAVTSSSRDLIKLTSDTSNLKLSFKNKDGLQYNNIAVVYANSTGYYPKISNANFFRTKECNFTAGPANNTIYKGDTFVLSSGDYSYVLKYTNYVYDSTDDTKTYVTLTDLATNAGYKVYANTSGETVTIGSLSFPIIWTSDTLKTICISLNGDSDYNEDDVNITTAGRATMDFVSGRWTVITEKPLYVIGNDPTGSSFVVNSTYSTTAGVKLSTTPSATQVGTANEWKYMTSYGSYVQLTGDTNGVGTVNFYNPGERPAPVNIAIGSNPVVTTGGGVAGGTYKEAVPVTNPIAKFPSEVTQTSALDKDLVLVGGPCANTLVGTLLNGAWNVSDSCAAWDAQLVGEKGLVQIVENIFGSGKKALIVAGTSAADTRSLIANKVIKPTEFIALGTNPYKGAVA